MPPIDTSKQELDSASDSAKPTKGENVRLLLTGFGAFGGIIDNPSTLAGRLLDCELLTRPPAPLSQPKPAPADEAVSSPGQPSTQAHRTDLGELQDVIAASVDIQQVGRSMPVPCEDPIPADIQPTQSGASQPQNPVLITFNPLAVTYEEVLRRVPKYHKSGQWDAIVHVGVAAGYPGIAIEGGSDRLGYSMTFPDADGKFPPPVKGGNGVEGTVDRWNTIVGTAELLRQQKEAMGFKWTFSSTKPGGYLCGFIYAVSLKWSIIVAEYEQRQQIPVIFIHVPAASDDPKVPGPYTIEELAQYLRAVCWFVGQHGARVKEANWS